MSRPTMYHHVQSLIAPIKAVSIGRLAHEAVCGDKLRARAACATERARETLGRSTASSWDRYTHLTHAAGLVGAAGLRMAARPLTLPLDLLVGTGRHRYTGADKPVDAPSVHYVEALLDHPLDTGLLGLLSAYNLAKHAMIAGCVGAAAGAAIGVVLWPFRGRMRPESAQTFVQNWVQRGAFFGGAFGALMGSCLIISTHNFIAVQGLRVLTAAPKLVANALGYIALAALALVYLFICDLLAGTAHSLARLWRPADAPGAHVAQSSAPSFV